MLGGKGIFRGSSMLVSGAPGTGKSSVGASVADAACARGERVLLFAYEESAAQLVRNMRSIGIDLARWVKKGLLVIHASRPTLQGLEQHLVFMYGAVRDFRPQVVVVDPISNLSLDRDDTGLKPTLMRLIDFLKQSHVTAVFTSLIGDTGAALAESQVGVSSLMDTWLLLSNLEANGERTRALQVIKSRGMPHSNQVREFVFSRRRHRPDRRLRRRRQGAHRPDARSARRAATARPPARAPRRRRDRAAEGEAMKKRRRRLAASRRAPSSPSGSCASTSPARPRSRRRRCATCSGCARRTSPAATRSR